MKLKFLLLLIALTSAFTSKAQYYEHKGYYLKIGYEFGLLSSNLEKTNIPFTNSTINNNYSHSISLAGMYKSSINLGVKFGYIFSQNLLGVNGDNEKVPFTVDHKYSSHDIFITAEYNIPIRSDIDISLGVGSSISFIEDTNITGEKGEDTDKIVATNNSTKNGNMYLIPEISLVKYFYSGNFISLGCKYYRSINDSFIEGSVSNLKNSTLSKQVNFNTQNNRIVFYINYGFSLSDLFSPYRNDCPNCGCF